jgi:ribosome-binding protein aMBF1 (putative translation factor)
VAKIKKPNSDAVSILHKRYFDGKPEMLALLEQARFNAAVAQKVFDLRAQSGLTQRQLAERIGTTASVISRLEDADYEGHSLSVLLRIATAVGKQVEINFVATSGVNERSHSEKSKRGHRKTQKVG